MQANEPARRVAAPPGYGCSGCSSMLQPARRRRRSRTCTRVIAWIACSYRRLLLPPWRRFCRRRRRRCRPPCCCPSTRAARGPPPTATSPTGLTARQPCGRGRKEFHGASRSTGCSWRGWRSWARATGEASPGASSPPGRPLRSPAMPRSSSSATTAPPRRSTTNDAPASSTWFRIVTVEDLSPHPILPLTATRTSLLLCLSKFRTRNQLTVRGLRQKHHRFRRHNKLMDTAVVTIALRWTWSWPCPCPPRHPSEPSTISCRGHPSIGFPRCLTILSSGSSSNHVAASSAESN